MDRVTSPALQAWDMLHGEGFTQERAVLATFGKPARTYRVGSCTVLVWNTNLLSDLPLAGTSSTACLVKGANAR